MPRCAAFAAAATCCPSCWAARRRRPRASSSRGSEQVADFFPVPQASRRIAMKTAFTLFAACVLALGAGTALAEPKCGDESRKQQLCENCEGLVAFEVIGRNYRLLS